MSKKLRVFISSPGDVGLERDLVLRVLERLEGEFATFFEIEVIRWEDRPVRATQSFQPQIIPPSKTDIVVCILWSRLGTPLSEEFTRPDGTRFGSGTEWEFEDAVRGWRANRTPDLLVYRRNQDPLASIKDVASFQSRLDQYHALEAFVQKWFFGQDGTFKAAFKTYPTPDRFEQMVENDLRHLIVERLPKHLSEAEDRTTNIRWHKGSPFSGLSPFDVDRASVFFGRTKAISEIKDAMVRQAENGHAFLVIFGMSGCGKSSLARAGVVATITRPGVVEGIDVWRWCVFRPTDSQDSLCRVLANAMISANGLPELSQSGVNAEDLAGILADRPQHAIPMIVMALRRAIDDEATRSPTGPVDREKERKARLFIVVDQLEEIFTRDGVQPADRIAFMDALSALARSNHVWVLATMRSDFYPRCLEVPELIKLKDGEGQYDLLPPTFDEIDQMITYPTQAAGLRFEIDTDTGQRLDGVIHEAAIKDRSALPLLSFTLDELYRKRTDEGYLTFAAYHELGGLEGALASRAESVVSSLPSDVQATLPQLMRRLVTIDPSSEELVGARRVLRSQLESGASQQAMLKALIDSRLLVADRADDGLAVVRVAHEALLTRWPRVHQWLIEDREFLKIRHRLSQQAERWEREHRRPDLLLPAGRLLSEAEDTFHKRREDLDSTSIAFVTSSLARRRRNRNLILAATAALGSLLTVGGWTIYQKWNMWATAITSTAEDRERNRREAARLRFDESFANARFQLINALPKSVDRALEILTECQSIAKDLADTEDSEERNRWLIEHANVLLAMSDAFGKKAQQGGDRGDAKQAMIDRLEERKAILESLPSEVRQRPEAQLAKRSEFSEARRVVASLQAELMIANEHLKSLLRKEQLLQQAASPAEGSAAQQVAAEKQNSKKAKGSDAEFRRFQDDSIKMIELMAESTGLDEDWGLYVRLVVTLAALEEYPKAHEFLRKALWRTDTILQKILAPDLQGPPAPFATELPSPYRIQGYVGMRYGLNEGRCVIEEVTPKGSAALAGLKKDDIIVGKVVDQDGTMRSFDGLELAEIATEVLGQTDEILRLKIQPHDQGPPRVVELRRVRRPVDKHAAPWLERAIQLHTSLADLELNQQNPATALLYSERALPLHGELPADYSSAEGGAFLYQARTVHARALEQLGRREEAVASMKKGIVETTQSDAMTASQAVHRVIEIRRQGAETLIRLGDSEGGIAELESAARLQRSLLLVQPSLEDRKNLVNTLVSLAKLHADEKGASSKLLDYLHEAFEACRSADLGSYATHPELSQFLDLTMSTAIQIFDRYTTLGQKEDAEKIANQALSLGDEQLTKLQSMENKELLFQLRKQTALSYEKLQLGEAALERYREAVAAWEADPSLAENRESRLPLEYLELALLTARVQKLEEAVETMEKVHGLANQILDKSKETEFWLRMLLTSALISRELQRKEEAREWIEKTSQLTLPLDDLPRMKASGDSFYRWLRGAAVIASELKYPDLAAAVAERVVQVTRCLLDADPSMARRETYLQSLDFLEQKWLAAEKHDKAESVLLEAIQVWNSLAEKSDFPVASHAEIARLWDHLSNISAHREDWEQTIERTLSRITHLEKAYGSSENAEDRKRMASAYSTLAWYRLFRNEPQLAAENARKALELSPTFYVAATNLINGYLLSDQFELAEEAYRQYKDKDFGTSKSLADYLRKDFEDLRQQGIDHPNFARLEEVF